LEEVTGVNGFLHISLGLRKRFADLARQEPAQGFFLASQGISQVPKEFSP
jgi:hypothetical protein